MVVRRNLIDCVRLAANCPMIFLLAFTTFLSICWTLSSFMLSSTILAFSNLALSTSTWCLSKLIWSAFGYSQSTVFFFLLIIPAISTSLSMTLICCRVVSSVLHIFIYFSNVRSVPLCNNTSRTLEDLIPSTILYRIIPSIIVSNPHVELRQG